MFKHATAMGRRGCFDTSWPVCSGNNKWCKRLCQVALAELIVFSDNLSVKSV